MTSRTTPNPAPTRYALEGRVVTMDAQDTVLNKGTIYIDGARIAAVLPTGSPPPAGFEQAPVIKTAGTIYPGLIELHNHLSYNVLQLWDVPQKYTNRDQWGGTPVYRRLISGPMKVLGQTPGYVEAIVRYVECKCLLGGVTTTQGMALFSNAGITRYYRGVVRNVEQADRPDLPAAGASIADVEAVNAQRFLVRLQHSSCLLLHLSEGTDARARQHFSDLRAGADTWALAPALAGIHCVALTADDFATLHAHGGSMVWSPLSNLLLYGATADVQAAKAAGMRIALGSDWAPSGSKNLLGELKVARLVSQVLGGVFTDQELVAMATRNAAGILGWEHGLGSVEAGKYADLVVVSGRSGDPYTGLLLATEAAIRLVVIGGVARYGTSALMGHLGGGESWQVGGQPRLLNLAQADGDPVVGQLTLREATGRLTDGMRRLPQLAVDLENRPATRDLGGPPEWYLVLDDEEPPDAVQRPYFGSGDDGLAAARGLDTRDLTPLSQIVVPLELDPLTVADDPRFLQHIMTQPNLPDYVKTGLPALYH